MDNNDDDTTDEVTYLVIGAYAWGHSPDLQRAKRNFTDAGGALLDGYNIIEFPVGLCFRGVDGMGRVAWDGDTENLKPVPTSVKSRRSK
jgi:hypothetical protein